MAVEERNSLNGVYLSCKGEESKEEISLNSVMHLTTISLTQQWRWHVGGTIQVQVIPTAMFTLPIWTGDTSL